MTDKQINIVEILAEQCKNCTLYEGDTVSLNISIFDRPLRGVCFDNIYFSVDELNYIMQKLISKEQECEELKEQLAEMILQSALLPKFFGLTADEITNMLNQLDQLKADNKHLNDLLNQALKELEKTRETLTEIKEIAENRAFIDNDDVVIEILQKFSEVEE